MKNMSKRLFKNIYESGYLDMISTTFTPQKRSQKDAKLFVITVIFAATHNFHAIIQR
jgi:hypothetical protein